MGEFASKVAKAIRKGKAEIVYNEAMVVVEDNDTLLPELQAEAGDILWQLAGLCSVMNWSLEDVAQADNRTLGDSIINRTLNCIYQLQLAYDSHDNTAVRLQALNAFDTEFSTLCTYLRVVNELRLLSLKVMVNIFERTESIAKQHKGWINKQKKIVCEDSAATAEE